MKKSRFLEQLFYLKFQWHFANQQYERESKKITRSTQVVCFINGQYRETTILLIFSPTFVTNSFIHSELQILE